MIIVETKFRIKDSVFRAYKQSKRRDDDIAIVNAAFYIQFEENSNKILNFTLAYGGMAAVTAVSNTTTTKSRGR